MIFFIFTSTTLCFHPTVTFSHRSLGAGKCSGIHHFLCVTLYLQPVTDFLFFCYFYQICTKLCWLVRYKKGKHVKKRHMSTVQSDTTLWKRKVCGVRCAEANRLCFGRLDWCSVWSAMPRRSVLLTYTVAVGKQFIFPTCFWEVQEGPEGEETFVHVALGLGTAFVLTPDEAGETLIAAQIRVCHSFEFKKQRVSFCFLLLACFLFIFMHLFLLPFVWRRLGKMYGESRLWGRSRHFRRVQWTALVK